MYTSEPGYRYYIQSGKPGSPLGFLYRKAHAAPVFPPYLPPYLPPTLPTLPSSFVHLFSKLSFIGELCRPYLCVWQQYAILTRAGLGKVVSQRVGLAIVCGVLGDNVDESVARLPPLKQC